MDKITVEGQPCRKCQTPVVRKFPKNKQKREKQPYYYKSYLFCPKCRTMYMVESEKVFANGYVPPIKTANRRNGEFPDKMIFFFIVFREVMNRNNVSVDIQKQIWEEAKKEYGEKNRI